MDIVKFTISRGNETELEAIFEEINNNGALPDMEKRQLMDELNEWSKSASKPLR